MERLSELYRSNVFRLTMLYTLLFVIASTTMFVVVYWLVTDSLVKSVQRDINTEISRRLGPDIGYQLGLESSEYAYFIEEDGKKVEGNIDKIPEPESAIEDEDDFVGPRPKGFNFEKEIDAETLTETTPGDDVTVVAENIKVNIEATNELKKENVVDVTIDAKEVGSTPEKVSEPKGELVGKTITVDNTRFFLGRNIYNEQQHQKTILRALMLGLLSLVVIGLVGGWIISSRSMRRINMMSKTSKRIMAGNFDLRIPASNINDDISDLTNNLNAMLDRINDLMQGMRQVTNNVAHDLRTPLTRLRGNLENMAIKGDVYSQNEAQKALDEVDELLKTFNALMSISQLESGSMEAHFDVFDIGLLLIEVHDFYGVLAEEKLQTFRIDAIEGVRIRGHRSLISQALVNIIDNAIKYSPVEGEIDLIMRTDETHVIITVMDTGEGFDDTYSDKLTERFFRLEKHRSTKNGNGLGLSLVNAVIKGHDGAITFANRKDVMGDHSGFIATITLPLTPKKPVSSKVSQKKRKK